MWGEVGIQCARRPALENPMKTRVSALPRAEFDWKLRVCAQRVFTSTNFSCAIFCWRTSSRLAVHNDNNSRSVERCSGSVSRMRTQTLHTLNTKTQNTPHGNYHTCLYHSQNRFIRILRLWGKGICKGHWGDVLTLARKVHSNPAWKGWYGNLCTSSEIYYNFLLNKLNKCHTNTFFIIFMILCFGL